MVQGLTAEKVEVEASAETVRQGQASESPQLQPAVAASTQAAAEVPEPAAPKVEPLRPGGLGSLRCHGILAQTCTTYGWIQPTDAIEHPALGLHGGLIWFSFADVHPGTLLLIGAELTFGLYADVKGLGAAGVYETVFELGNAYPGLAAQASLIFPCFAEDKAEPAPQRTPLSFSAKTFTPGLEYKSNNADFHRSEVLPDSVALNAPGDCGAVDADFDKDEIIKSTWVDMGGILSPTSICTTEEPSDFEKAGERQLGDKEQQPQYAKQVLGDGFSPPPGLPAPPGLEGCVSLKVEG